MAKSEKSVLAELIKVFFSENANEKKFLLDSLQLNSDESDEGEKGRDEQEVKPIELTSLLQMFKFCTFHDVRILCIAVIFTIIHGAAFPVIAVLFANFCDRYFTQMLNSTEPNFRTFSSEYSPEPNNLTQDSEVNLENMFGSIGDTIGLKANTIQMSRDDFLAYGSTLSIYMALGSVIVFVAAFLQTACWECAALNQIFRIRQKFLAQVLRQDISWFDNRTAGYLIVKLADDVERMREGIGHKFGLVVQYTSCFVIGVFFGLCTNWKLTLLFGASVPLVINKILSLMRELTAKSIDQQDQYARMGATSNEVLGDPRTVAAFGTENEECELYQVEQVSGLITAKRKYKEIGISVGILYLLVYGSYALAFWYAANQLVEKAISPTEIYTVFFCVSVGVLALVSILPFIPDIAHAYGCSKVITEIIATMPTIDPYSRDGQRPRKIFGKIKFSNVTFSYPSRLNATVIRDVSFTVKSGETVAIAGASGAGKSTLLQLLLRFYDPQSGYITFDDVDFKNLNVGWLRNQMGFVSQNLNFDEASIFENIRGGKKSIKLDEVVRIAMITGAHSFIQDLPEGYDTIIGVSDKELSTGQRQLLALTRAVIRKPKILVLDECLSGIDTPTARIVTKNVLNFRAGCTNIIVSHRLAMLQRSNKIIVIEDGQVVEDGTNAELLAARGPYYRMAEIDGSISGTPTDISSSEKEQEVQVYDSEAKPEGTLESGPREKSKIPSVTFADVESSSIAIETSVDCDCILPDLQYPSLCNILAYFRKEGLITETSLGLLGCIISGIIIPFFAFVFGHLFLTFFESRGHLLEDVLFWVKILIAAAVAMSVGYWLRVYFVSVVGEILTQILRTVCYLSILRESMAWFDEKEHSANRLFVRLASDAPLFKVAIGSGLGMAISAFISMIAALAYAAVVGWQFLIVVLLLLPLLFGIQLYEAYLYTQSQHAIMEMFQPSILLATKSVQNIRTVQAFSLQSDVLNRYIDIVQPILARSHRQAIIFSLAVGFTDALILIIISASSGLCNHLIRNYEMESISFFKVFTVITFSAITAGHFTSYIPDFANARLAFGHVFCYFDIDSSIDSFEELGARPKDLGRICFDNVYFSYPQRPERMVLQGVSFTLEPGKCLVLMGDLGKTTILSLLERFYDVTSGHVTFGGLDIKDLKLDYLRASIGYVSQDSNLFNRTIRDNILYGLHDMFERKELDIRFEAAAEAAGISGWHLPKGYDTVVGVNGNRLTGGQKQKVAIARAMIRDPRILLLDMPVSALGPGDERGFLEILKKVRVGRTCIVVSTAPNVIRAVDLVAVLKGGKIVEFGTQNELNALKGVYYDFMRVSK